MTGGSSTGQLVPAIGAGRRVRALVAAGWPMSELARRCGWSEASLSDLAWDRRQLTASTVADAIKTLYGELQDVPGESTRARNLAYRHGWPTPAAWDPAALDDPAHKPGDRQDRRCPTCGSRLVTNPEPSDPY